MPKKDNRAIASLLGETVDDACPLDYHSFLHYCAIDDNTLTAYIEYDIICPLNQKNNMVFDHHCMQRGRIARRLQQDMAVNLEGIVIILDLLERVEHNN